MVKIAKWSQCTRMLKCIGAAICLLIGLWIFVLVPCGGDVLLAEGAQVPSPSVKVASSTAYTVFLPIVFSDYSPVPTIFGMQMYDALHSPSAALPLAQQVRVYWVRWPLAWSAVEPVDTMPQSYYFGFYDSSILSATQAGLHLIVTVSGNPGWAAHYTNGPIDKVDIGAFTEFVGTLAERYDGDGRQDAPGSPVVDYWEFYNEPDGGDELYARYGGSYWGYFGAEYARMLCAVYPVIKAAHPGAQVVLGGIAQDGYLDEGGHMVREFLDDVLAAGGGQCFDVMNFHYYPGFESVWAHYGKGLSGKANYLRSKLGQYGLVDKPMVCTEAGWGSNNFGIFTSTPEIQSRYVVKLFAQSLASHLDAMTWWTWIDIEGYGDFGLLRRDLQRKPAYYAYQVAAKQLGRAAFQRSLSASELGSTVLEGYRFALQGSRPLYVLWSNDELTRTVALPLSGARVTGLYGDTIALLSDNSDGRMDGQVRVTVGPNPVYVEVP